MLDGKVKYSKLKSAVMKPYLHVLVVIIRITLCYNLVKLQTYQGMYSRHNVRTKRMRRTLFSIDIVIDDRLKFDVNKIYMYMILVVSIYAFLFTRCILI